jgi:hypothetical protein
MSGSGVRPMVNAIKVAADFIDRLPKDGLSPETTAGYEGYVHPYVLNASVEKTTVKLLIRDFESNTEESYRNMKEVLSTLAATPHRAKGGTRPMPSVAPDITKIETRNTRRRPYRSPKWLRTMPPTASKPGVGGRPSAHSPDSPILRRLHVSFHDVENEIIRKEIEPDSHH